MRFLTGIVVGAVLTIGVAYIHDSALGTPSPDRDARTLVNWSAFDDQMRDLRETLAVGWNRLNDALPRRS